MDYEHVSWCAGKHDTGGECLLERTVSDATIGLLAVPCSHVNLWVDGAVYDVDEMDRLVEQLQELRPLLAAADREAACEGHDHSDDDQAAAEAEGPDDADSAAPSTGDTPDDTDGW